MNEWVAGVDGCRGGWFRSSINLKSGERDFQIIAQAALLLALEPRPSVLAIDIPIGLTDAGSRECDLLARKVLGPPRASSVFPAPIRPAIRANSRLEASAITEARDGRRVPAQAFGIFPKAREVDDLLQAQPAARQIIYEVHPELCFWAWAGRKAIVEGKKTGAGQLKRVRLAENWLGAGILEEVKSAVPAPKRILANDDILDSIAALWTACRISRGEADSIPANPPSDLTGLPMRMVY